MRVRKRKIPNCYRFISYIFMVYLNCLIKTITQANTGPITGKTPCCLDRLTTIICQRQKQQNPALFLYKCMQNSDFAFIQCCQSCFDQKLNDVYHLDYQRTSELLLTNPVTAQCDDRRSEQWCRKFMQRSLNWTAPHRTKLDCSNVPVAFRLCRKSCGYCASSQIPAQAIYNYPDANDAFRCHNPSKGIVQRRRKPAASKSIFHSFNRRFSRVNSQNGRKKSEEKSAEYVGIESTTEHPRTTTNSPDDYFLVTDHNYENYEEENIQRT